jgi:FRG domain
MTVQKISDWTTLQKFIDPIGSYLNALGNIHIFRGQSNAQWKLESSLLRIVKGNRQSEKKISFYEQVSIKEFYSKVHLLDKSITDIDDDISRLTDMQHYSYPTRLLDWSISPYIALYFAVKDNFENDGALFVFDTFNYEKRMKFLKQDYNKIPDTDILTFDKYEFTQQILSTKKNHRILRQQGLFTVSNNPLKSYCDIISNAYEDGQNTSLFKLIIPKELKLEFLGRLRIMNISAELLFPDLYGLGKSISESMSLRKWNRV